MRLRALKDRLSGRILNGEAALHGDSLHLSKLRRIFDPLTVSADYSCDRPLIALAFTNRSGSTYLGQLLASQPELYGFREDLNHNIVARRAQENQLTTFTGYLQQITNVGSKPDAGFGLKTSAEQLRLLRMTGFDRAFEDTTVIRIRRRDRVAQAVSLWLAWTTRQWTSQQIATADIPHYDFVELRRYLQSVLDAENALDLVLSVLPYPVLSVDYETLCVRPDDTIAALRRGLGLPPSNVPAISRTCRQSSEEKSELVSRFRADLARRWSIETHSERS